MKQRRKKENGTKEKKRNNEEAVVNVCHISNFHTNDSYLTENSEALAQTESRSVVVNMTENNVQSHKRTNTKRYYLIPLCFVAFIVLLCIIIGKPLS